MNLLEIENGWNIAGEDIAEEERTEGKDSATNKIWMAKRWEYIHREYEYLNSGFFFFIIQGTKVFISRLNSSFEKFIFRNAFKISNS